MPGCHEPSHKLNHLFLAVVSVTKENKGRTFSTGQGKKPGEIQVSGNEYSFRLTGPIQHSLVSRVGQANVTGMNGIMAFLRQPLCQGWRQRHVHQELHEMSSTVSASAR